MPVRSRDLINTPEQDNILQTIKELKAEYAELKAKKSELYKDYQKARRDYTEIAVARKNIDIILDRDHDGVHDFLEKDERERSK